MNKHADFVHLHVHSQYSLLDGACRIHDLVEAAKRHQMPALAITDHGNLFGVIDFYDACMKGGVKPILGLEAYIAPGSRHDKEAKGIQEASFHLILLAKNEAGYRNLLKLVSAAHLEGFYYRPRIDKEILRKHSEGLICLSSCLQGEVSYWLAREEPGKAAKAAGELAELFPKGDFYLEIQDHGIPDQRKVIPGMLALAKEMDLAVVATNDLHYLEKSQARAHEALLCVQTQTTVYDPKRFRFETDEFYFKSPQEMQSIFAEFPQAILNTRQIAEKANVELDFSQLHLPQFTPPEGKTQEGYLAELVEEGMRRRYPNADPKVRQRIDHELSIIRKTGFTSYFLITWDVVHTAKSKKIPVGPGRGSAAGSVVSFCLGITDLDPLEHDLIFERFLNADRISMPDIDIDFCYERRGEVIEYVTNKYGKGNVAQVITFGTLQAKAVVRDVARALGFSYPEADRIAKLIPFELNMSLKRALDLVPELKGLTQSDPKIGQLIETSMVLEGLTRHASTHAAGVVIADGDLTNYVPLYRTSEGQVSTGYAMEALEKIGLLKMDFLGLRTLTVIDETAKLIRQKQGTAFEIEQIPLDDSKTYAMLAKAEAAGIFQLESSGMRDLLRKLKPERFQDLIALVALFRPGPLGSGMVEDFIQRRHGQIQVAYDHPKLEPVLQDTYGVCVSGDTIIEDVKTGTRYRIKELDQFPNITVQGINAENRTISAPVLRVIDNGLKSVYRVRVRNGFEIKMTRDHRILTETGWKQLGELAVGDYIATPRSLIHQAGDYDLRRLRVLAYLIADGDISNKGGVNFVSVEPELLRDYEECLESFELVKSHRILQVRGVTRVVVSKPSDSKVTYHTPNGLLAFLREHGLKSMWGGCRSWEKFIPPFIFTLRSECIATFLAALWDCDGFVGSNRCHYVTTSHSLARDVQILLLKLGITSTVYTSGYSTKRSESRTRYQVTVYDGITFSKTIQPLMKSRKRSVSCHARGDTTVSRRLFLDELSSSLGEESRRAFQRRSGFDPKHFNPSRRLYPRIDGRVVRSIAERMELLDSLRMLRLQWEPITEIERAGTEHVYDLEVAEVHNFVANGIIVHNCIYQEQVMRIAHELAGFTLSEGDILRKAMGKKTPEIMEENRAKFISGCIRNGIDRRTAEKIFDKIEYFAGYAFNRSHSAAYALISYRTAFLKANFPVEFMTALLTSERDNTEKIAQYIEESRRMGIQIGPPDVNASFARFTVEGGAIRYGLLGVKNVGEKAIESIIQTRQEKGPFTTLPDFCERVDGRLVNRKVIDSLIKCGAFDSFKIYRSRLAAGLDKAMELGALRQKQQQGGQLSFFEVFGRPGGSQGNPIELPNLEEWLEPQLLAFEKGLLGFYLTGHPLARYRELLQLYETVTTAGLRNVQDSAEVTVGGVITKMKITTTKRANERMAILSLEDFDGSVEILVFPKVLPSVEQHLKIDEVVLVRGRASLREERPKLMAQDLIPLEKAWESRTKSIRIRLNPSVERTILEALKEVFRSHPGEIPVELTIENGGNGGTRIAVGSTLRVAPSLELFQTLIGLVGAGSIAVKKT
ncbi:MAG: DNA polymerase III subunit alpha [Candidatus Omnitrophica bacterium]|nr:DNA polymerase III subunit alpha [Candidatus Omnitrophota bacterium]